jgi:Iap family predicted aminopeptidase
MLWRLLGTAIVTASLSFPVANAQAIYPDAYRLSRDIATLASDKWEGRLTCTAGIDSAAVFIAARFDSLRLKPMVGAEKGRAPFSPYFDPFNTAEGAGRMTVPAACQATNVVGMVRGTDSLVAHEYVVVGAHYDHLGRNTRSSMDPQSGNVVRNGADDNASGTAGVMELARLFAMNPPRRSVIFVAFTAEEWGMVGSRHFVTKRLTATRVLAMVNLDMVGRLRNDSVFIDGSSSAAELPDILNEENSALPLNFGVAGALVGRSDHVSFSATGIPAVHFTTGTHPDYHTSTDDAARINTAGVARIAYFAERVVRRIADGPGPLLFIGEAVRR